MIKERKMKFSALISVLFLCFVFVACATDEDEGSCITAFDCPDGYSCIDSVCRQPSAETDTDSQEGGETHDSSDTSEIPGDSDNDISDDVVVPGDDDNASSEIPDDITGCPKGCSGFGECDPTTVKCICDDKHQGEDCSECAEGYHLEAADDDEDGDGAVSCAPNITCSPNPCNNNGCKEVGNTVQCTCVQTNHLTGRWCESCAEGYIKSNSDGKCKEDCSLKTCTPPQKCGIDYATNEANCNECDNAYYSGTDCTSCDTAHFCNGHATACVVEGGTEKCTCEAAYMGEKCNTCATGYFMSNGSCVKNCDAKACFKSYKCTGTSVFGFETTATVSGHGTCSNTTGECICDAGWLTESPSGATVECGILTVLETLYNVECSICDKNNPPSQYASSGCPQELTGDTSLCNSIYSLTFCGPSGSCYYEPTGSHQLYCVCSSGYHLDNGDKYTGYCTADE